MIETVRIVQRLTSEDTRKELEEFCRQDNQAQKGLTVAFGHSSELLSFFAPEFWPWCFVELFPYGDCSEHVDLSIFTDDDAYSSRPSPQMQGSSTREATLRGKAWSKVLLLRADHRRWRLHPEWLATAFSAMLQREQMHAIKMAIRQPAFQRDASKLDGLRSEELLHAAEQLGQHACVRDALRSSGVPPRVKTLLTRMQLAQQDVRCTDAYRSSMQKKFSALRLWHGSQIVFFTLNPADTKHQFTVSFACRDAFGGAENVEDHHFFLTRPESAKDAFYASLKPMQLQQVVASDPVAAVRCFYLLVRMVCNLLLHCTIDAKDLHADGIASRDGEGVLGFVSSIAGAVEAQARFALHVHFLLATLGFQTPDDLRTLLGADFAAGLQRIWGWISSIYWRSPEGFASYLDEPCALDALQDEELVPVSKKQRALLQMVPCGVDRAAAARDRQLEARGLDLRRDGENTRQRKRSRFSVYMPDFYGDPSMSSSEWAKRCSVDFNAGVIDSGNHKCRPEVCYKGRLGRRGWCRMRFFHKVAFYDGDGRSITKMVHGAPLVPRWRACGDSAPPVADTAQWNAGEVLVEQHHPFVGPLTGAMY